MRAFCDLELGSDPIPDETTILNFRHLLEAHGLTKTVSKRWQRISKRRGVAARWHDRRCDIIAASPSTKNEAGKRDPLMHSSKKGNQWYFGMKTARWRRCGGGWCPRGGDGGNVHDAKVMDRLVREDDSAVYGDKGYANDTKKRAAEAAG